MIVKTGTPIDLLNGGIPEKSVSLIYGPTGCGKTTLLVTMSNYFIDQGSRVVYIDTEESVYPEHFKKPENVEIYYAKSLKEQKESVRKAVEAAGDPDVKLIVLDTLTGHFHREVLRAPGEYRAKIAGDLSGQLVAQIAALRKIMSQGRLIVATAHLRSPVSQYFRESTLRKITKAVKEGKYIPSTMDFQRYIAMDPVQWIGGQGLGMHVQYRFRIFVDEDDSRIVRIDKWPAVPNWAVKYVYDAETGQLKTLGERFMIPKQVMIRLLKGEYEKLIQAEETIKIEEEGVPVEVEEEKPTKAKTIKKTEKEKKEVKLQEPPDIDILIDEEKKSG